MTFTPDHSAGFHPWQLTQNHDLLNHHHFHRGIFRPSRDIRLEQSPRNHPWDRRHAFRRLVHARNPHSVKKIIFFLSIAILLANYKHPSAVSDAWQSNQIKPTTMKTQITTDDFTRINSDVNGNPRYYVPGYLVDEPTARRLGAVKYRGKQYGDGWVFQSYNIHSDVNAINAAR
jgi:hypothetical protein